VKSEADVLEALGMFEKETFIEEFVAKGCSLKDSGTNEQINLNGASFALYDWRIDLGPVQVIYDPSRIEGFGKILHAISAKNKEALNKMNSTPRLSKGKPIQLYGGVPALHLLVSADMRSQKVGLLGGEMPVAVIGVVDLEVDKLPFVSIDPTKLNFDDLSKGVYPSIDLTKFNFENLPPKVFSSQKREFTFMGLPENLFNATRDRVQSSVESLPESIRPAFQALVRPAEASKAPTKVTTT
jgi:hypothetical protein